MSLSRTFSQSCSFHGSTHPPALQWRRRFCSVAPLRAASFHHHRRSPLQPPSADPPSYFPSRRLCRPRGEASSGDATWCRWWVVCHVSDTRWSYESVNVPVLGSDCFLRWRFLPGNWSRSEITKPLTAENNRRGGGTWTYCGGLCVVGLQSDADSLCLICHNKLNGGAGGSRELQCTHTFHKEVTHTNTREDREWSVSIKMLLMFLRRLYKVLYERTLFCCTVKLLLWQTGSFVATEACGAH